MGGADRNALISFDRREPLLVEMVGIGGLSGCGESWSASATVGALIEAVFAKGLLGKDPAATGRLWHAMRRAAGHERQGIAAMAIAALDLAAHDLAARARGVPLHALLGGGMRDRVPAYASGPFFCLGGHPYRQYEHDIETYRRAGSQAIKVRIGHDLTDDAAIIATARGSSGRTRH